MRKSRLRMVLVVAGIGLLVAGTGLYFAPPVIWSLREPGDPIGEPIFVLLNPIRNRNPESTADKILRMLRDGKCDQLFESISNKNINCVKESENPLSTWSLYNRTDSEGSTTLYYRVVRESSDSERFFDLWVELKSKDGEWIISRITDSP